VSFSVVSLIAIVPDSECTTPTLIVSSSAIAKPDAKASDAPIAASFNLNVMFMLEISLL
jgi:hypothetical protein